MPDSGTVMSRTASVSWDGSPLLATSWMLRRLPESLLTLQVAEPLVMSRSRLAFTSSGPACESVSPAPPSEPSQWLGIEPDEALICRAPLWLWPLTLIGLGGYLLLAVALQHNFLLANILLQVGLL